MGGGAPKETVLCLVPQEEPTAIIAALRKKFPDVDIHYHRVPFTHSPAAARADVPAHLWRAATVLCTFNSLPESTDDAPHLRWLQLLSAGSNHIQDTPVWEDDDVTITTASGIHGPQIAEWALLTALVHSHHYKQLYELQKAHRWAPPPGAAVRDRVGLRLGVLGYGSIGRQVGRVAHALGMRVLAYTATPKDTAAKRRDGGYIVPGTGDAAGAVPAEWFSGLDKASLHHFLKQELDWLVVAVPLTAQTRHFLSGPEFDILAQRRAFVTNIARGPILDQAALVAALKDGRLGGAALDVTDPEPLPADSELWGLENVVVTPHVAGQGTSYAERAFQVLEMNLERRLKGERMVNVVDRGRGY